MLCIFGKPSSLENHWSNCVTFHSKWLYYLRVSFIILYSIRCGNQTWLSERSPINRLVNEKIIDQYGRFWPRKWLPNDVLWSSSMLYEIWSSYHYWAILIVLLCQYVYHINSCVYIPTLFIHSYENLGMTSLYSVYKTHLWTATHFWGVVPGSPGSSGFDDQLPGKPWFIQKAGQIPMAFVKSPGEVL